MVDDRNARFVEGYWKVSPDQCLELRLLRALAPERRVARELGESPWLLQRNHFRSVFGGECIYVFFEVTTVLVVTETVQLPFDVRAGFIHALLAGETVSPEGGLVARRDWRATLGSATFGQTLGKFNVELRGPKSLPLSEVQEL